MTISFNAGYLDRRTRADALQDFVAGNFHIILLQESQGSRLPNLALNRGIVTRFLAGLDRHGDESE
jgi:hypothetical protein